MIEYKLISIDVGAFNVNCYVLKVGEFVYIIDPGSSSKKIINCIEENSLTPSQILLTHAHIDHISAVPEISKHYGISVYLDKEDIPLFKSKENSLLPFYLPISSKDVDLVDNIVGNEIKIIHTPGHTRGGVCLYVESTKILFSGDTLFLESIGRTDLPGGDHVQLVSSIKNKLALLPDDVIVYPGHGPKTSIGHEKRYNDFLQ